MALPQFVCYDSLRCVCVNESPWERERERRHKGEIFLAGSQSEFWGFWVVWHGVDDHNLFVSGTSNPKRHSGKVHVTCLRWLAACCYWRCCAGGPLSSSCHMKPSTQFSLHICSAVSRPITSQYFTIMCQNLFCWSFWCLLFVTVACCWHCVIWRRGWNFW